MNKVKVEKFLTWRLGRKEELKPGQGYKCAPSMSAMNTPLPESPTGCDHLVSRLSCVPCCNCDTLSLSDTDSSPELGKPFGRISQFRPHDIDSQWDRCIGSVGSACSNGREVGLLSSAGMSVKSVSWPLIGRLNCLLLSHWLKLTGCSSLPSVTKQSVHCIVAIFKTLHIFLHKAQVTFIRYPRLIY